MNEYNKLLKKEIDLSPSASKPLFPENMYEEYVCVTDSGKVRELNEDACFCSAEEGLWIVADGMGGHSCGEVASALAVASVRESCLNGSDMSLAIQKAHHDVLTAAKNDASADGMGTTIVTAKANNDDQCLISWVGDSRAYLWDKSLNTLKQLTRDHSLVERLLEAGLISENEAKIHPQRHMITQCLGSKELESLQVDEVAFQWQPEQILLLCSDGLTEELSDEDITMFFTSTSDIKKLSEQLLTTALNNGGQDNISLVLLKSPCKPPEGWQRLFYNMKNWIKRLINAS